LRRLLVALVAAALAVMLASSAKAITNGEPDNGRHPYVGLAVFEAPAGQPSHRCSASLLSPTVVLTAGHCTDGTAGRRPSVVRRGRPEQHRVPFGGATSYEGVPYTYRS
jgi:V8-like Glu-specific endopeptidase